MGETAVGTDVGATSAVDVDRDGQSVWVGERCGGQTCATSKLAPILKFDPSGMPGGIFIDANDVLYVSDSLSGPDRNPGWIRGIRIGSAKTGTVDSFIRDQTPDADPITAAEGVAADRAGNVYGAVVPPQMLQRHVRMTGR